MKKLIFLCMLIGSIAGGYLPALFGVSVFSLLSVFGNFIGGLLGIWIGFKLYSNFK